MANSKDKLSATNRAMLVGAILGGGASIAKQWKSHQAKDVQTNELCAKAVKDSIKAGLIAGGTTYVAGKMAGRPVLSMATILATGTAGLYLMDQFKGNKKDEE